MQKLTKVVIPAAGMGTRLLPTTKEQPKEMLPIFGDSISSEISVKPILQIIFEQLYEYGFKEYFFVVGRTKRAIEDHFTPDYDYLDRLNSSGKVKELRALKNYYNKLSAVNLVWINQPFPQGFGHSVLLTKNLLKDDPFLVHAGDTVIISKNNRHLSSLMSKKNEKDDCRLLIKKVNDPRQFGVIEGKKIRKNLLEVNNLEEKPTKPKSNLAIMPLYRFESDIFTALEKAKPDKRNEIQLTDGIKNLKKEGKKIMASQLLESDIWIDVGSPETYWDALNKTHRCFFSKIQRD